MPGEVEDGDGGQGQQRWGGGKHTGEDHHVGFLRGHHFSLIVCVNGTPWRHAGKAFVAVSDGPGPCSKRSDEAESREDGSDRAQGCLFLRWDWPVGCGVLKDSTGACEPWGAVGPGSGVQLGPAKWTMVT